MPERIGQRQYAVLHRARRGRSGNVMPGGFLERRACHRLTARGLLEPLISFPDVWTLTPAGRTCWVVVQ